MKKYFLFLIPLIFLGATCTTNNSSSTSFTSPPTSTTSTSSSNNQNADIIFLHHSTGENIWYGGVPDLIEEAGYSITEQNFPTDSPYGWENYPYDYWNIWVNHGNEDYYLEEPTLSTLTQNYDLIIWKHCYPVGYIMPNTGNPDVSSSEKTLENYQLQYNELKNKMHEYPDTKFLVWTGAAMIEAETDPQSAKYMQEWVNWITDEWDEEDDNIFLWDFYNLETEGGLYLKKEFSAGDSHPNEEFSNYAAPLLVNKIIEIIN